MITLHGHPINVGDEVWDIRYGFMEVVAVYPSGDMFNKIEVSNDTFGAIYSEDGRLLSHLLPSLFWSPISSQAIDAAKQKPKKKVKKWRWVLTDGFGDYAVSENHYTEEEINNAASLFPIQKITESEIEVEG